MQAAANDLSLIQLTVAFVEEVLGGLAQISVLWWCHVLRN